jgi:PAS domain S-box-containing protein
VVINIHDITERKQAEERQHVLTTVSETLASSLDHDVTLQEITKLLVPSLADYCRIAILDEKRQIKDIAANHIEPEKIALVRELYEQYKDRASATYGLQELLKSGKAELISSVSQEMLTSIGQESPELFTIVQTLGLQSYMGVPLLARGRIIGAITFSSIQPSRHYTPDDLTFAQEVARRIASALDNARLYREAQKEIAKRKKAEEEHYRLAAIVESSNDAIIGKTLNGMITSWNDAAEQLFGYTAQEAIGKPITTIIPPELHREEEEIISKLRQGIRIQYYETVRVRKDGTKVDVSLSISPVKDSEGNIIGAAKIARDITERKELERRKDEFISMASHELKTPVTSLKGFTQLLHRRFRQRDDEESLRFLARMDAQIANLTKLISDLLDISKMQTGQLAYREEPFDLDALVQEIVENVQGITQTHRLVVENPARVRVYGDRDRIGQVLINLLTNAIKYSPNADRVIVRITTDGANALVSVQDLGMGIDEAYQEKIFERFYQVNEPEMQTYPGLGIGLYIASEIIKRHQGRIWVQSRKGEGSTFSFSLPLLEDTSAEA